MQLRNRKERIIICFLHFVLLCTVLLIIHNVELGVNVMTGGLRTTYPSLKLATGVMYICRALQIFFVMKFLKKILGVFFNEKE